MAMAVPIFSVKNQLNARFLSFLLLCLLFGFRPVVASSSTITLSSCSLSCLLEGIDRSSCSVSDLACTCTSSVVTDAVTTCMLANCTMQESLELSRYTAEECGYSHSTETTQLLVVVSVLFGVSVIFVILRLVSKAVSRTFCTEDYIIISAMIMSVAPLTTLLWMIELGLGKHMWDLQNGALSRILRLLYAAEICYVAALALTKISLVFMYLRIFWAYRPFKLACIGALLFIVIPSIAIIIATILSCHPIPYFWDRDIRPGSCVDILALAYANSALAVAQDASLIILPIFMLRSLNMSRKKKLFIGLMFVVGSIGFIATIVRLTTLYVFGSLADPTYDYIRVVYWTTIELAAGLIASCMPAVRILLERFFKVFHLSTNSSEGGSKPIRMERQTRPTFEVIDPLDLPDSKGEVWDGSSQRGLVGTMSYMGSSYVGSSKYYDGETEATR